CGGTSTPATGRRRMSANADSTLGRGTKTLAGTVPTIRAVAQYATFTLTAPYASVPACAHNRSATSRCTITSIRCTAGTSSRRSHTNGVATLYGKLATSTHCVALDSSASQSSRIASASTTVTLLTSATTVR